MLAETALNELLECQSLTGSNTVAEADFICPLDTSHSAPSIALLITYFGKLPIWFPVTMRTMAANSTVDFYLFVDTNIDHLLPVPANIHFVRMTAEDFRKQASAKLGYHLGQWDTPMKLCDFRSALGHIFEDLLLEKHFDYWGWCDVDLIFGDIRTFLTPNILKSHHIVASTKAHPVHGPFTIMRTGLRYIYKQIPNIQANFMNPKWMALDEGNVRPGENIHDLVKELVEAGKVLAWHQKIAATDRLVSRRLPLNTHLQWKGGKLIKFVPGESPLEIFYYHFQHSKDMVKQTYTFQLPSASYLTLDPDQGFIQAPYRQPSMP